MISRKSDLWQKQQYINLYHKQAPKNFLKSKRNQFQNNPLENNVKRVPAKSSTLFSGGLFWRQLRFGRNCSTLFSGGLFWRQLRFGGNHNKKINTTTQLYRLRFGRNWPHIIFRLIVLEGSSDMAETTTKKLTTVLYTKYVNNTKNYFPTEPNKLTQYFFSVIIFSGHNFINKETCQKTQLIIFIFQNMKYGDIREHLPKKLTQSFISFPNFSQS